MSKVAEAGAIAVRDEKGSTCILIITAKKDPSHWIFPKGHIGPNENAEVTAVRELREEAGVEGKVLVYVGALEFISGEEEVHVDYYLIEHIRDVPPKEERQLRWCTYAEALELLSFDDARSLLSEKAWPLILERSS